MTDGLGWSADQYEQWLQQSMHDLLLSRDVE
jgi:hypothetical protein